MKIIHISPSYYPAIKFGGPVASTHLLNKCLVKKNIEVDVLTTNAGLNKEQRAEIGNQWGIIDGVRIKYVKFIGYEHYNFSLPFVYELKKIITNYDLVHITSVWNFPVLVSAFLCNKYGIPYMISPHGALMNSAFKSRSHLAKKFYLLLFAKNYLKKAKVIHFTSRIERNESISYLSDITNFIIVPNGLQPEAFNRSGQLSHKFNFHSYILYVGRIHPIKGLDILIKALKGILDKDLGFVLAGPDDNGYGAKLEKLAESIGILRYLRFIGNVDANALEDIYKNAKLFVLPSRSENFGMSAVEAMANGTPVLISDKVGIHQEVEKANAGIVVQTNVDSIKAGILEILKNKDRTQQFSENGKRLVKEKFDINNVADQMIQQYQKLVMSDHARI